MSWRRVIVISTAYYVVVTSYVVQQRTYSWPQIGSTRTELTNGNGLGSSCNNLITRGLAYDILSRGNKSIIHGHELIKKNARGPSGVLYLCT